MWLGGYHGAAGQGYSMPAANMNVDQIRELLDYLEAEAMASTYEQRPVREDPPRDYHTTIRRFLEKYEIVLPLAVAKGKPSPAQERKIRDGFKRDWREHQAALNTLRPLFDLFFACAEGKPGEVLAHLHEAAFPHASAAMRS